MAIPGAARDAHPVLQLRRRLGNRAFMSLLRSRGGGVERASPRGEDALEMASAGTTGPAGPLPHLAAIQRSFGRHDVTGVQAHTDAQASTASRALGAAGYTMGDHVAFAGTPDLHTAAHEAAHVVQQRAGVHLSDRIGRPGDRYERHADAVADLVVAGRSAAPLLDRFTGARRHGGGEDVARARPAAPRSRALPVQMQQGVKDTAGKDGPRPGPYQPVGPYRPEQVKRLLLLYEVREKVAWKIANETFPKLPKNVASSAGEVSGVVFKALVLHDTGKQVLVGIQALDSEKLVFLGEIDWEADEVIGAARDFAVEKARDWAFKKVTGLEPKEWVLKKVLLLSETVAKNAAKVLDILGWVFTPLEFGKGDVPVKNLKPLGFRRDQILRFVIATLEGRWPPKPLSPTMPLKPEVMEPDALKVVR
jgi:hypothetical protein